MDNNFCCLMAVVTIKQKNMIFKKIIFVNIIILIFGNIIILIFGNIKNINIWKYNFIYYFSKCFLNKPDLAPDLPPFDFCNSFCQTYFNKISYDKPWKILLTEFIYLYLLFLIYRKINQLLFLIVLVPI